MTNLNGLNELNELELMELDGGAIPPILLDPAFYLGLIAVFEFVETVYNRVETEFYEAGKAAAYKELGY